MSEYLIKLKDSSGNVLYPMSASSNTALPDPFSHFGAHRGFSSNYPECTMPAFQAAYDAGFKMLEVDIVQSSDGVQFCLHDATIDRTSNGTGTASEMTAEELLSYDYGFPSKFGTKFQGTTIPTLREACMFCKKHGMYLELDLADNRRYSNSYLQNTYDVVKSCGMLECTFFCAQPARLRALIAIDPTVKMSVSGQYSQSAISDALDILAQSKGSNFSIEVDYATQELVEYVHNLGYAVKVWLVASSSVANTMFGYGVECVLTDNITPSGFIID